MNLQEKLKHYKLSEDEYTKALSLLNKEELSVIEWALFSSLWSEHCSYKSSKVHLKNLYNKSIKIVSEEGENAGVVDLGEGEKVAFKMESHNHPSFIEPFQGASTGVGGILRDIFTMGARPIALANYLCFGEKGSERLKTLIEGVVSGISFYGNCVGVPNITGQTEFDKSYNKNNLVNAFALGYYGKDDKIISSKIKTPGHLLVYVGAKTGKDGVHGASMASESFDKDSESKRPTVQIGDPFYEKCLIESCLEVMKSGLVEAVQDMGAAGLTSSSFEMSYGGGLGLEIDLSKVPLRQKDLTPEEILLSESQERMLLTCSEDNLEPIQNVFKKWGLDAEVIGSVRKEKEIKLYWKGELVCEISPEAIVGNAPQYNHDFEAQESKFVESLTTPDGNIQDSKHLKDMLSSVCGASRSWIYDQYDQRVGAKTLLDCSEQIGAVVLPESKRSVGVALGCRPHLMKLDSKIGAQDAFLHPAICLAAKGYTPWAVTDCLNFGNPQKKKVMSDFVSSLKGLSEACEAFEAPIISGNVSLFNETEDENIAPTPAVGVVGLNTEKVDKNYRPIRSHFQKTESTIYLVECSQLSWTGYSGLVFGCQSSVEGRPFDLAKLRALSNWLVKICGEKDKPFSSRVVSKFGLGFALSNMLTAEVGFQLNKAFDLKELYLEKLYQVILEMPAGSNLEKTDSHHDFSFKKIGKTASGGTLDFNFESYTWSQVQNLKEESWSKNFEL